MLIKDHDCTILYNLGKANVVTDTLSQKSISILTCMVAHLRGQPMINEKIKTT